MQHNQKVILGIIAVVFLIAVVYFLPTLLTQTIPQQCTVEGQCVHEQELKALINWAPVMVVGGFLIGAIAFYFFAETKKVERVEVRPEKESVLRLLEKDERKIVSHVADEGGRVLQSELSHLEGIGKVKAHRLLERLEKRGVIEKETHGKTNLVKLAKEIKEIFG